MTDEIIHFTKQQTQAIKTVIEIVDDLELNLNHASIEIRDKEDKYLFEYPQVRDLNDHNTFLRELFYGEIVIFDEEEDEE